MRDPQAGPTIPGAATDAGEAARRVRSRNRAMLVVLLALVALIYGVAIVKMTGGG